jgi:hypothetical protein
VRNPSALVTTNIRQGITVNGTYKSIESLTPAEVEQVAIIQDIWNKFKTKKENRNNVVIDLQPMTYSDKKRQMTKAIALQNVTLLSGHNLLKIARALRGFEYNSNGKVNSNYQININLLLDEIISVRGDQTKYVAINLLNKVSDVLGLDQLSLLDADYGTITSQ